VGLRVESEANYDAATGKFSDNEVFSTVLISPALLTTKQTKN
jgi:hypothetical protein